MKPKLPLLDRKYRRRQRAIALVIVLAMVSMMTIFMLAIFSVSRTEHSSSIKYADGQSARELADTAVNVVMSQIWDGTNRTAGDPALWASQPGAIRKYEPNGSFRTGYRLYSSSQMQLTGAESEMVNDVPPSDWTQLIGRFTDLNEPVVRPDKDGDGQPELVFPIIDPRAYIPSQANAVGSTNVEGFWYGVNDALYTGVVPASSPNDLGARLPMPVEWLYVLKNGMLGTMDGSGERLRFVPASTGQENTPSEENPIVGRIAFWTDDETCKININTAGEPTPWYTPQFVHEMDQRWAFHQPMSFEYQRYPGHPATVAMSAVLFPNLPMDIYSPADGLLPIAPEILARKERIYQVMPKLNFGGSRGGTVPYWRLTDIAPEIGVTRTINDEVVRIQDSIRERLYASVDEMMFSQNVVGNRRQMQDDGAPTPIFTTQRELERARFFLTAQSRAPETTMFGTPRIAMWPVHDENPRAGGPPAVECRTGYDQLIAFCSSSGQPSVTGARSYFFRRRNSQSPTEDIGILRNQQLLAYLTNMLSRTMPGGSSYLQKYGQEDTQQMVVQMFDYIRSTNLYDGFLAPTRLELLNTPAYRMQSYPNGPNETHNRGTLHRNKPVNHRTYTADRLSQLRDRSHRLDRKREQIADAAFPGHGQVVPSRLGNAVGFGRFVTVSEVGFHFICTGDGNVDKGTFRMPERVGANQFRRPPPPPTTGGYDKTIYSGGRTAVRIAPQEWDEYAIGQALPLRTPMPRRLTTNGNPPGSRMPSMAFYRDGAGQPELEDRFWYSNYPPEPPNAAYGTDSAAPEDDPRNPLNHPGFWPENWNATLERGRPLEVEQKRVQAMLNLEICAPSLGYDELNPEFSIVVRGLQRCRLSGLPLFIAPGGALIWKSGRELFQESGCNPVGGFADGYAMSVARGIRTFQSGIAADSVYDTTANTGGDIHRGLLNFELISRFTTVTGDNMTFGFNGGPLEIEIYAGHAITPQNLVQVINVQPPSSLVLPTPELVIISSDHERTRNPANNSEFRQRYVHAPSWWAFNQAGAINRFIGDWPGSYQETQGRLVNNATGHNRGLGETLGRFANWGTTVDRVGLAGVPRGNTVMFGFDPATGNFNSPLLRVGTSATDSPVQDVPGDRYSDTGISDRWPRGEARRDVRGTDVVFSMVPAHGDPRLIAAKAVVPATEWVPHPKAEGMATRTPRSYFAHNISRANANVNPGYDRGPGGVAGMANRLVPDAPYSGDKVPDVPATEQAITFAARYGDFDNAVGAGRDGAWLNKPDTGSTGMIWETLDNELRRIPTAYFQHSWSASDAGSNYTTPNRQIASPGMFGSLPTRVRAGEAWRTLLFRPFVRPTNSAYASAVHPGASPAFGGQGTADHHVMDLFWMPIVEPYAISEPFSTAGKINMNYQIVPFRHISRATGMHAALKGELIAAVPLAHANQYLNWPALRVATNFQDGIHWQQPRTNSPTLAPDNAVNTDRKFWHRNIEIERRVSAGASTLVQGTLGQFDARFRFLGSAPGAAHGLFRTASQICEVHLLPRVIPSLNANDGGDITPGGVYTVANMTAGNPANNFWMNRAITGENVRERVYTNIYNKVTTQSNTFRVHFKAQVIKKARSVAPDEFDITKENAVSEYRGSALIERKIDPNDPRIPDYAVNPSAQPLDAFYRFRVLETKRFTP
jgi:uncharacterized protein (TIGR02600 family)